MQWEHRIIKHAVDGHSGYMFAEVYYDDVGDPTAWSECFMTGDSVSELMLLATRLLEACGKPVVEFADNE